MCISLVRNRLSTTIDSLDIFQKLTRTNDWIHLAEINLGDTIPNMSDSLPMAAMKKHLDLHSQTILNMLNSTARKHHQACTLDKKSRQFSTIILGGRDLANKVTNFSHSVILYSGLPPVSDCLELALVKVVDYHGVYR